MTYVLTGLCVDLAKAIVTHLVHEAVEEDRGSFPVNSELSCGGVVVMLLDVSTCVSASPNSYHPEKFVDICDETHKVISTNNLPNCYCRFLSQVTHYFSPFNLK